MLKVVCVFDGYDSESMAHCLGPIKHFKHAQLSRMEYIGDDTRMILNFLSGHRKYVRECL
jgi:spore cortex formation protein SpoVR/YcgB (stage V sporulation)